MAYGNMTPATANGVASSAANNQIITNVDDLDTRADVVEARTTNVSGTVGIGNQQLSDRLGAGVTTAATADARLGSGVGTGSNVTTGSATSQLTDARARIAVVETRTLDASTGNPALGTRVTALEAATGGAAPHGSVLNTAGQTFTTSATPTKVQFDSLVEVRGMTWDDANDRFVCTTAGLYLPTGGVTFTSNTTLARFAEWRRSGTVVDGTGVQRPAGTVAHSTVAPRTIPIRLTVGQYIELFAGQNSGGNLTIETTGALRASMALTYIAS